LTQFLCYTLDFYFIFIKIIIWREWKWHSDCKLLFCGFEDIQYIREEKNNNTDHAEDGSHVKNLLREHWMVWHTKKTGKLLL